MSAGALRLWQFEDDLETIASHYLGEAGVEVAVRFVRAVEDLVDLVGANPRLGSTRYSDLGVPGLRSLAMERFPYVVFYGGSRERVLFWRILHGSRDIPEALRQSDSADITED